MKKLNDYVESQTPENLAAARPSWWTAKHEQGLSVLTNGWQCMANIREEHLVTHLIMCDLWLAGYCEKRVEPYDSRDLRPSAHLFYRLPQTLASTL